MYLHDLVASFKILLKEGRFSVVCIILNLKSRLLTSIIKGNT